jgi:enoyl reductase-like protein
VSNEIPKFTLGELFTPEEITAASKLWKELPDERFVEAVTREVVKPVIERINKTTKQQNDPLYFGYVIQYTFRQRLKK